MLGCVQILCHSVPMPAGDRGKEPPVGDATGVLLDLVRLDRSSPVPLYFQLAQGIQGAVVDGLLPPGSRIDNEILLAERLGVSRPTVRQAMQYLVEQGLVVRRRGIGTKVVQPQVRRPLGLTSLFDDLRNDGQEPTTAVLTLVVVPAEATVAAALGLEEGDDVVELVRLRSAGTRPIAKMTNYLPVGRVELTREAIEMGGLYELIRSAGVTLHAATQTIGARTATAAEARLLEEPRGAALLTMQRTAYDDQGVAVEHGSHVYAASRYSFQAQLLSP